MTFSKYDVEKIKYAITVDLAGQAALAGPYSVFMRQIARTLPLKRFTTYTCVYARKN